MKRFLLKLNVVFLLAFSICLAACDRDKKEKDAQESYDYNQASEEEMSILLDQDNVVENDMAMPVETAKQEEPSLSTQESGLTPPQENIVP